MVRPKHRGSSLEPPMLRGRIIVVLLVIASPGVASTAKRPSPQIYSPAVPPGRSSQPHAAPDDTHRYLRQKALAAFDSLQRAGLIPPGGGIRLTATVATRPTRGGSESPDRVYRSDEVISIEPVEVVANRPMEVNTCCRTVVDYF